MSLGKIEDLLAEIYNETLDECDDDVAEEAHNLLRALADLFGIADPADLM